MLMNIGLFPASSVPQLFHSQGIHPIVVVVLISGGYELPALDLVAQIRVDVLCLAFLALVYKCKVCPPSDNTVMFISLLL